MMGNKLFVVLAVAFSVIFLIPLLFSQNNIFHVTVSEDLTIAKALSSKSLSWILIAIISALSSPLCINIRNWLRNRHLLDLLHFPISVIIWSFTFPLLIFTNYISSTLSYPGRVVACVLYLLHLQPALLVCSIISVSYGKLDKSHTTWPRLIYISTVLVNFIGKLLTLCNVFGPEENRVQLRIAEISMIMLGYCCLLLSIRCHVVKFSGSNSGNSSAGILVSVINNREDRSPLLSLLSVALVLAVCNILSVVYPSYAWERLDVTYFIANSSVYFIFVVLANTMDNQPDLDKELMALKMSFFRFIAHELRTPLNSVVMGIEVLSDLVDNRVRGSLEKVTQDSEDYDEDRRILSEISRSCDAAVEVIDRMVLYEELQSGSPELTKKEVSVWIFINGIVSNFIEQAELAGVELTVVAQEGEWDVGSMSITADERRLGLVIGNLMRNSLAFTPRGGRVDVQVEVVSSAKGYALQITVIDTGCGISQDRLSKLFDVGSQFTPGTLQPGSGSGLGLAISRGIVEAHGGKLDIFSEGEGLGCKVTLSLPMDKMDDKWTNQANDTVTVEVPVDDGMSRAVMNSSRSLSPSLVLSRISPRTRPSVSGIAINSLAESQRYSIGSGSFTSHVLLPGKRMSAVRGSNDLSHSIPADMRLKGVSTKSGSLSKRDSLFRRGSVGSGMFRSLPPSLSGDEKGSDEDNNSFNDDDSSKEDEIVRESRSQRYAIPAFRLCQPAGVARPKSTRVHCGAGDKYEDKEVLEHKSGEKEGLDPMDVESYMALNAPDRLPSRRQRSRPHLSFELPLEEKSVSNRSRMSKVSSESNPAKDVPSEGKSSSNRSQIPKVSSESSLAKEADSRSSKEPFVSPSSPGTTRGLLRVLVVDDVLTNRKMLSRMLEGRCDTCVMAEDGVEAVKKFREAMAAGTHFDVITMDYQMPNMDGPTATKIIRELGYRGMIIGVTGNSLPADIATFIAHGANTVLLKPLKKCNFDACLRDLL